MKVELNIKKIGIRISIAELPFVPRIGEELDALSLFDNVYRDGMAAIIVNDQLIVKVENVQYAKHNGEFIASIYCSY